MSVSIGGTAGVTFNDASVQNTAATGFGFKNRLINGNLNIWQRGTSLLGMTPSLGVSAYTADRWFVSQLGSQSATDVTQQTGGATKFSIRVQKRVGSTGASRNQLGQVIESVNCTDLAGKSVSLSFTAKAGANYSATSNNLLYAVYTCTTADQSSSSFINGTAAGQVTLLNGAVQLTTSNQTFTLPVLTLGVTATNICIVFEEASSAAAAGSNDWFEVSDLQLEKGSTATSFDYRPFGTELALCQRYYTFLAVSLPNIHACLYFGSTYVGNAYFPTTMRSTPTITASVGGGGYVSVIGVDGFNFIGASGSGNYVSSYTASSEL